MIKPELGQRVSYQRVKRKGHGGWWTCTLSDPRRGIVVSKRAFPIFEARVEAEDAMNPKRKGTLNAYLIAYSMHRKLDVVMLDDLEIEAEA